MGEEKKDQEKENGGGDEKAGPVELKVDIHCVGCARKIKKSIKSFKGVENVEIDMDLNKIVVKGNVDPVKLCERVQNKSGRKTELISPLPKKEEKVAEEKEKKPEEEKEKPEPVVVTVVLKVNMHCEGCAQQVEKIILKMKGVNDVHTNFKDHEVTVKGTMEPTKLVHYLQRKTGKKAQIVTQPPPPEKTEDEKKEDVKIGEKVKKEEDKKEEEKKDGGDKKEGEEKKEEAKPEEGEKKGGEETGGEVKKDGEKVEGEEKKDAGDQPVKEKEKKDAGDQPAKEEEKKDSGEETVVLNTVEEKKNEVSAPKYVIEHVYPPQLFSDENPNACSIM